MVDLQTPGEALKEWPESPFSYVLKLGLSKTEKASKGTWDEGTEVEGSRK